MGKYTSRVKKPAAPKRNQVNPFMRGIGCLLMMIVPVFSYAAGDLLAEQGFGYQILPASWYGFIPVPQWAVNLSGLNLVFGYLASIRHLPATLAIAVVVLIVVGGLISVIFGWIYSLFAPPRYGPTDVPPVRIKTKKYKR